MCYAHADSGASRRQSCARVGCLWQDTAKATGSAPSAGSRTMRTKGSASAWEVNVTARQSTD
eukprot:2048336-Heterocapsa_arctica.AAC.1